MPAKKTEKAPKAEKAPVEDDKKEKKAAAKKRTSMNADQFKSAKDANNDGRLPPPRVTH